MDAFVEWAYEGLLQTEEAQAYVSGRGVSRDQWKRHKLGYVAGQFNPCADLDPDHSQICSDKKAVEKWCDTCRFIRWSSVWEASEEGGPFTQHVGKRLLGCIVLPLTSYSGNFVGFQIRAIREKRFDSFTLSRKPEGCFFGIGPNINAIWSSKTAFVVEGPFDQLVFERLVSPCVVALTTNAPNTHQSRFFRRFTKKVGLFLDKDKAGRDGADSFEEKMEGGPSVWNFGVDVKAKDGTRCKDMNEAWKALGDKRFREHFTKIISDM